MAACELAVGDFLFGSGLKNLLPRDLVNETVDDFGVPYLGAELLIMRWPVVQYPLQVVCLLQNG